MLCSSFHASTVRMKLNVIENKIRLLLRAYEFKLRVCLIFTRILQYFFRLVHFWYIG